MKEYTIKSDINSHVEKGNIDKIIPEFIRKFIKHGNIIVWLDYKILFGFIENEIINFYEEPDYNYTIRIRAFNEDEEIHIWKSRNKYFYRYRKDTKTKNEGIEYIDAEQLILGTSSKSISDEWIELKEDKGSMFILPNKILNNNEVSPSKRLFIKTRNYLDYNQLGQISFIDNRFVKFLIKEG